MPGRSYMVVYVGDIGREIIAPAVVDPDGDVVDLTGATLTILVHRPDGTLETWSAVAHDAPAGVVKHVTSAFSFDESGLWLIQARALFSPSRDLRGPVGTLRVEPALDGS